MLAPRIIKSQGWAWMPGMRISHVMRPFRILRAEISDFLGAQYWDLQVFSEDDGVVSQIIPENETFPDLDDPATLGCALTNLRVALSDPTLLIVPIENPSGGHDWQCRSVSRCCSVTPGSHRSPAGALTDAYLHSIPGV